MIALWVYASVTATVAIAVGISPVSVTSVLLLGVLPPAWRLWRGVVAARKRAARRAVWAERKPEEPPPVTRLM